MDKNCFLFRSTNQSRKRLPRIQFALLAMFATALLFTKGTKLRAATITVTNTADSGNGTLRAALASAAAGDTINFSMPTPANFTLTSGELLIPASVSILGPGANNVAIDGNNTNRVFHIGSNTVVNISGLTITHGNGGIFNDHATLTLSNSTLSGNSSAG